MRFGRILQLTVLNLQMKKPICNCRTVIVVGSYNLTLTYCTLFPCFLHHQSYIPPITFSIEKFLIYLFPNFLYLPGVFSQYYKRLSVFVAMLRFLLLVSVNLSTDKARSRPLFNFLPLFFGHLKLSFLFVNEPFSLAWSFAELIRTACSVAAAYDFA